MADLIAKDVRRALEPFECLDEEQWKELLHPLTQVHPPAPRMHVAVLTRVIWKLTTDAGESPPLTVVPALATTVSRLWTEVIESALRRALDAVAGSPSASSSELRDTLRSLQDVSLQCCLLHHVLKRSAANVRIIITRQVVAESLSQLLKLHAVSMPAKQMYLATSSIGLSLTRLFTDSAALLADADRKPIDTLGRWCDGYCTAVRHICWSQHLYESARAERRMPPVRECLLRVDLANTEIANLRSLASEVPQYAAALGGFLARLSALHSTFSQGLLDDNRLVYHERPLAVADLPEWPAAVRPAALTVAPGEDVPFFAAVDATLLKEEDPAARDAVKAFAAKLHTLLPSANVLSRLAEGVQQAKLLEQRWTAHRDLMVKALSGQHDRIRRGVAVLPQPQTQRFFRFIRHHCQPLLNDGITQLKLSELLKTLTMKIDEQILGIRESLGALLRRRSEIFRKRQTTGDQGVTAQLDDATRAVAAAKLLIPSGKHSALVTYLERFFRVDTFRPENMQQLATDLMEIFTADDVPPGEHPGDWWFHTAPLPEWRDVRSEDASVREALQGEIGAKAARVQMLCTLLDVGMKPGGGVGASDGAAVDPRIQVVDECIAVHHKLMELAGSLSSELDKLDAARSKRPREAQEQEAPQFTTGGGDSTVDASAGVRPTDTSVLTARVSTGLSSRLRALADAPPPPAADDAPPTSKGRRKK